MLRLYRERLADLDLPELDFHIYNPFLLNPSNSLGCFGNLVFPLDRYSVMISASFFKRP